MQIFLFSADKSKSKHIQVRFLVDTDTVGCNWLELPAGSWRRRDITENEKSNPKKTSRLQIEVDIAFNKIISHKPEGF